MIVPKLRDLNQLLFLLEKLAGVAVGTYRDRGRGAPAPGAALMWK